MSASSRAVQANPHSTALPTLYCLDHWGHNQASLSSQVFAEVLWWPCSVGDYILHAPASETENELPQEPLFTATKSSEF